MSKPRLSSLFRPSRVESPFVPSLFFVFFPAVFFPAGFVDSHAVAARTPAQSEAPRGVTSSGSRPPTSSIDGVHVITMKLRIGAKIKGGRGSCAVSGWGSIRDERYVS